MISIFLIIGGLILIFWDKVKSIFESAKNVVNASGVAFAPLNFLSGYNVRGHDDHGSGSFGAPRGDRDHEGLDLIFQPDALVKAPFDCVISKHGQVYPSPARYKYIEFKGLPNTPFTDYRVRFMYVLPIANINQNYSKDSVIGKSQDIEALHDQITDHIHCEVYSIKTGDVIDPTQFL